MTLLNINDDIIVISSVERFSEWWDAGFKRCYLKVVFLSGRVAEYEGYSLSDVEMTLRPSAKIYTLGQEGDLE